MNRRMDAIEIGLGVMDCPHHADCKGAGSLWGDTEDGRMHRPSAHIGGEKIDEYCVYFLAQNPGNATDHHKFDSDDDYEFLERHHEGLVEQFTPGDVLQTIGLKWEYVVWENVVRCPTKDNEMNDTLVSNCSKWTERQLEELNPDVVIAMGTHARDYFGAEFGDLTKWFDSTVFYCMYHYGYLMRQGSLKESCKEVREKLEPRTDKRIWT